MSPGARELVAARFLRGGGVGGEGFGAGGLAGLGGGALLGAALVGAALAGCVRAPAPRGGEADYGRPPPPSGPAPGPVTPPASDSPAGLDAPAVAKRPAPPRPKSPFGPTHQPTVAPFQRGKATYYADSLAGNPTASGERYDPGQLTAAHRSLPFGSLVDVVRRDGRWVRVRITDRGPFAKGRVIDLSRRAAEAIGMIDAGVVDVTLYVVRRGD